MNKKLLILDRDGVINQDRDDYVKSADEWQAIPGALQAMARARQAGWIVTIASNQSGLGRGLFDEAALHAMHEKMRQGIEVFDGRIDSIFYCPHSPDDNCDCRKPKPGLLHQIARHYGSDLTHAVFIGDSLKDIQTAQAVNAKPVLVRTGKGAKTESLLSDNTVPVFDDLPAAITHLLSA
ncbi:MAG TPA: D-glycero-beta-D-manno-heptose 1,7-bisphosphate 7-phosphatase [Gammaproteobacteria bacterium]|nr:D-glycero-beta-D-manno-heptose 1,7-bisphosphate 7-phosphatase [Gammaproteobacteria bacterium]